MQYNRKISVELFGIVLIFVTAFACLWYLPSRIEETSINKMRQEEVLKRTPMTIETARVASATVTLPNETAEEKEIRLQKMVDDYNRELRKKQDAIRRELEKERESYGLMSLILFGLASVLILGFAISAILKKQEGIVFQVRDQAVMLKPSLRRSPIIIPFEAIQTIRYDKTTWRHRDTTHTKRDLSFLSQNGELLGMMDLTTLSGADFNDIYQVISARAPHIEWKFPS